MTPIEHFAHNKLWLSWKLAVSQLMTLDKTFLTERIGKLFKQLNYMDESIKLVLSL